MIIILLLNQPDVGQSIFINHYLVINCFISGVKIGYIFLIVSILLICSTIILLIFPERFGYIIQRFNTFFDPH